MKGQKMVEILNGYGKVVGCKCIKTTSRQVSLYLTENILHPPYPTQTCTNIEVASRYLRRKFMDHNKTQLQQK